MRQYTLKDRLRYRWDNLMSRGPAAMIAVLVVLTALFVFSSALLLITLQIRESGQPLHDLPEALWVTLMRTLDPGNVSSDHGWSYRLFMLMVTLAGIFIVSALISILSSGLQVKIDELRKGRSLVVERNHTVILGWSPKIFTILEELILSQQSRRDACVVILAERDKVQMEDELRLKLPKRRRTRIVCRAGNPTDPHDLELVSPHAAKSIVVLAPEGDNPDAEIIKTILALTNRRRSKNSPYHIVAEIRESANLRLAHLVGKEEAELVAADDLVARMTVQATRQLGLSLVYSELMDFEGGEMYFDRQPALHGRTYADCILSYPRCTVMGMHYADGRVTVNPPMDSKVTAKDEIVLLAEDDSLIRAGRGPVRARHPYVAETFPSIRKTERILILGWNDMAPIVMRELDRYLPRGSSLTLVSSFDVGQLFDEQVPMLSNVTTEYWKSSTSDRQVLDGLDVPDFDHVIVLAYRNHLDEQECDAQTLMTLLHLRDICNESGRRIGLLSEMLDVRNRELAEVTQADDFIVSDRLVSLLITQVTENKHVMRIFDDLFHQEGSEVFIRPAEQYVHLDTAVDFYAVAEAAIAKGETPLGYRVRSEHFAPEKHYGLHLNPNKEELFTLHEGDQIIVLAPTDV